MESCGPIVNRPLRRLDDLAHAPSQIRASSAREVSSTSPRSAASMAILVVAFGIFIANGRPLGFAGFLLAGPVRERMTVLQGAILAAVKEESIGKDRA